MSHTRPQVILDPGHGGTVAYGGSTPYGFAPSGGGLPEKHVNLDLARRVAARLGSIAQLTRSGDTNLSLRDRAELAARSGARVLVSLHANAGGDGSRGSEVWLHERHARSSSELARDIDANLDRIGPTRGVFTGPLAVLDPEATGGCAACLVEADYLTDPHGRGRLTEARGLDALADAISSGIRTYLGRGAYGEARGLPNLRFGIGPEGQAIVVSTAATHMPTQITWIDHNDSDTMAGSYYDTVTIFDPSGQQVFHEPPLRNDDGLRPRERLARMVWWTPRVAGTHRICVRLNSGEYAIPEDTLDDNYLCTTAEVGTGSSGGTYQSRRFGAAIAARQVSAPLPGMQPRYRADQNFGTATFHGMVRPGLDFTNNFVWLVWPHRRHPDDPPAAVHADLTFEIFEVDPERNANAVAIDTQTNRVDLGEDQQHGFEYSRLTPQQDYYVRITFTDYSQTQDAGRVLWTNAYG
ncbi:MAG: N-acetylmuramoyl-L-alanine amidase [Deltaproteobacteria bacterium]|nr:N-acetylmuramoyl-L-alanine amidase [Deltaproteobacteria bacterium]